MGAISESKHGMRCMLCMNLIQLHVGMSENTPLKSLLILLGIHLSLLKNSHFLSFSSLLSFVVLFSILTTQSLIINTML